MLAPTRRHTAGAQVGARKTPGERLLGRHGADIDCALFPNPVFGQQIPEIVDKFRVRLGPRPDTIREACGQIRLYATGAVIIRVQARTGCGFVELHELLALFVAPKGRRQRADIHGERGEIQQVVQDSRDLVEHRANPLRTFRRLDAEQALRRQNERVFHAHGRHVVQPVEIRRVLRVGAILHQLFGAAMEQSDMRIRALHDFAVHFEHEAEHAVCRWMLRTEIDGMAIDLDGLANI